MLSFDTRYETLENLALEINLYMEELRLFVAT